MRKFRDGQSVMVSMERPLFTDDGLIMEPYEKPARFVEHTPKPWEPESCRVDYGDGPRKCVTTKCRRLRLKDRLMYPRGGAGIRALAEGLRAASF